MSLPSNLCQALKLFTKSKVSLPDCLDQSSFIVIGTPLSAPLTVGIGSRLQPPALATQFVRALASSLLVPTSPRFLPIPLSLSFCNCDFPRLRPPVSRPAAASSARDFPVVVALKLIDKRLRDCCLLRPSRRPLPRKSRSFKAVSPKFCRASPLASLPWKLVSTSLCQVSTSAAATSSTPSTPSPARSRGSAKRSSPASKGF